MHIEKILIQIGRQNGSAGSIEGYFYVRQKADQTTSTWKALPPFEVTTEQSFVLDKNFVYEERTDIKFRVTIISDNSTTIQAYIKGDLKTI